MYWFEVFCSFFVQKTSSPSLCITYALYPHVSKSKWPHYVVVSLWYINLWPHSMQPLIHFSLISLDTSVWPHTNLRSSVWQDIIPGSGQYLIIQPTYNIWQEFEIGNCAGQYWPWKSAYAGISMRIISNYKMTSRQWLKIIWKHFWSCLGLTLYYYIVLYSLYQLETNQST